MAQHDRVNVLDAVYVYAADQLVEFAELRPLMGALGVKRLADEMERHVE